MNHRPAQPEWIQRGAWLMIVLMTPLGGCTALHQPQNHGRLETPIPTAVQFLLQHQDADGAWRSETYASFNDGPTLTPIIALALHRAAPNHAQTAAAVRRAGDYLIALIETEQSNGSLLRETFNRPLDYPTYTAALAGMLLQYRQDDRARRAASHWLTLLGSRQLDHRLGWREQDLQFGGWGYYPTLPHKPGQLDLVRFVGSNISATVFAVDARVQAGVKPDDQTLANALKFAYRCQNFDPNQPRDLDGGFFFSPTNDARNKAGPIDPDDLELRRFRSYGSASADGLRLLLLCGLDRKHPRIRAAKHWLTQHFSVKTNPGQFARDREVLRDGFYYYYCRSLARTLALLGDQRIATPDGAVRWTTAMADQLTQRQCDDGSWMNPFTDGREDESLLATAMALEALAICRDASPP